MGGFTDPLLGKSSALVWNPYKVNKSAPFSGQIVFPVLLADLLHHEKIHEIKKRPEFFKTDFKSSKRGHFMHSRLKIFMKKYTFKWELKYLEMNKKLIHKKRDKF